MQQHLNKQLFDKSGRRITTNLSAPFLTIGQVEHKLKQPQLTTIKDYAQHLNLLHKYLDIDTGITSKVFKTKTEKLLAQIKKDSSIANILNSVYLPIVIPKLKYNDLGQTFQYYLNNIDDFCALKTNDKELLNRCYNNLANEVTIADNGRQKQLLQKIEQEAIVGIYFPETLLGFSTEADREQIINLPPNFILSGLDVLPAMLMYPEILISDNDIWGMSLAGVIYRKKASFYLISYTDVFTFDYSWENDNTAVHYDFSGGLLFIE